MDLQTSEKQGCWVGLKERKLNEPRHTCRQAWHTRLGAGASARSAPVWQLRKQQKQVVAPSQITVHSSQVGEELEQQVEAEQGDCAQGGGRGRKTPRERAVGGPLAGAGPICSIGTASPSALPGPQHSLPALTLPAPSPPT